MTLRRGKNPGIALVCALGLALALPAAGIAGEGGQRDAIVPSDLLAQAQANPDQLFHVIVQGDDGASSSSVAQEVAARNGKLKLKFRSLSGVAADVSGKELLALAGDAHVAAISTDSHLASAGYQDGGMYLGSVDAKPLLGAAAPGVPAIAIVDSGIDATDTPVFGSRIAASVNLSSLAPGASGDQQGHGTMVASLAAGAPPSGNPKNNVANFWGGVAQTAPLVDVRTADANGQSLTSDVIAACDWILAHKAQYNIRVANFSMIGDTQTSFRFDPLDRAVERLWFNGIVVVAAAGNFGTAGSAVDMSYAPGNDPFVITVGAADQSSTAATGDDTVAPWSAYGHTADGFAKPELSAPGRYLVGAVNTASSLPNVVPTRIMSQNGVYRIHSYMWMSGTSFAAPIVAGAAAQLLARHPGWTPDQVKGALMLSARYLPLAGFAAGVGEIDAAAAANASNPPNPNENLDAFVGADPTTGELTFDQANWTSTVSTSANWTSANWTSANWTSANWTSANWTSANWTGANWTSANWTSANWTSANWTGANWTGANWTSAHWGALIFVE
jgi:serine protease AprX